MHEGYVPREGQPDDTNLIGWIQGEMRDMLDFEVCHEVDGPFIFGPGNFDVVRGSNGQWFAQAKPDYKPAIVHGLFGGK